MLTAGARVVITAVIAIAAFAAFAAFTALAAAAPPAAGSPLHSPPLPPGVTATPVESALQVDGLTVEVYAISAPDDAAATTDAIAEHWARERPTAPVVRSRAGEWRVLGRGEPAAHETVQLRATASGSEGYFSRRRAAPAGPASRLPVQPPRGSRTLLSVVSTADSARSHQTVLSVAAPPRTAKAELLANARRAGWRELLPAPADARRGSRAPPPAVRLVRDADELVLAVVPLGSGSGVVFQHLQPVRP